MPDLTVIEVSSRDDAAWEAFLGATPDSQFPHRAGWRRIVEDVQGHQYIGLAAIDPNGEWHGVLPVVRMKTPGLGHVLISMPFLNYGGPLGTVAAQRRLIDHVITVADASGASEVHLRCRTPCPADASPVLDSGASKIFVTLDMSAGEDVVWKGFPAKLRSQIRRPQKEGMELRTGAGEVDAFYDVFARNMRDLGTPVYSKRFFRAIRDTFTDSVFTVVYLGDQPVGAACGFIWNGEFEITWASTVRDYNKLSPNMLLYWGLMQEMMRRGVHTFNFGRSTPDTGPHRFKMQWGGEAHVLPWAAWHAGPAAAEGSASRLKHIAAEVWKRVPLSVANRVGPWIAPRLPWW